MYFKKKCGIIGLSNIFSMKKFFSVFVLLSFIGLPVMQVFAISPQEVNAILSKKRDTYTRSILKAHKRAIAQRTNQKTTEIKGGLWRQTQSLKESAIRTRPSYTADSFRMKAVRTPEMLQKTDRRRTGITQRRVEQPRMWSRTRTKDQQLRVRKFNRGGDAFKQNIGDDKTSIPEQRASYLRRKRYEYNPLDSK